MKKLNREPYRGHRDENTRHITVLAIIVILICISMFAVTIKAYSDTIDLSKEIDILSERIADVESSIDVLSDEIDPIAPCIEEKELRHYDNLLATYPKLYTEEDAIALAKMLWGEARGVGQYTVNGRVVSSECQKAAVIWTVLNRYDAGYSSTIKGVVTAPNQFSGYSSGNPVDEELMVLVTDVLDRWNREKNGESDVGRVIPSNYLWFYGDGRHNHFKNEYRSRLTWDWRLGDVYSDSEL